MKVVKPSLIACAYIFCIIFLCRSSFAMELSSGIWGGVGEGAHGENGTLIVGINVTTKVLSGYYESSDRSRTINAECRFYFEGKFESKSIVPIRITGVHPGLIREKSEIIEGKAVIQSNSKYYNIVIYPDRIPPSCDWLYSGLPSYVPPPNFKLINGLSNSFQKNGSWQAVNVIRSKRAYFYRQPTETSKEKKFLVAGDLIYIYEENPDWYYAKYQGERKDTSGWIKRADTVQFSK